MRNASLWRALLGVEKTVVEDVEFDEDEQVLVAHVRPRQQARRVAAGCAGAGAGGMTRARVGGGGGRWIWARSRSWLEADAPRVCCPEHGVVVAAVPWARHGAGHTRASMSRSPGWPPSAPRARSPS